MEDGGDRSIEEWLEDRICACCAILYYMKDDTLDHWILNYWEAVCQYDQVIFLESISRVIESKYDAAKDWLTMWSRKESGDPTWTINYEIDRI